MLQIGMIFVGLILATVGRTSSDLVFLVIGGVLVVWGIAALIWPRLVRFS